MAYLKPLAKTCGASGCVNRATVELYSVQNAAYGAYCRLHGQQRLKALQAAEAVRSSTAVTQT